LGNARVTTLQIDAHHHVWDLAVRDQPWMSRDGMSSDGMAPLRRSFGVAEFEALAKANGVTASIVVQTVADVAETEELLDLAAATPIVAGVVGWVDVAAADVGDQLDRILALPTGSWLAGIRSLVQYEPDPHWLSRKSVIAGLAEVAGRGLCNELLVLPHQLDEVLSAVREVAGSRFVIDHLAKPSIASSSWEPWATQLGAVARQHNVSAKVSGLVTEADWSNWTAGQLQPYVDHALAAFGPERLLVGSDWPVCTLAASYQRIVDLSGQLVSTLSTEERAGILGGNATRLYSLDHSSREGP
jgi:L-fuconolactonase